MTPKKRRSRIYWRTRGGVRRAYGDFRDYADVGVGRKRSLLRVSGSPRPTATLRKRSCPPGSRSSMRFGAAGCFTA